VDGGKMSKSLGNFYSLHDVFGRGFSGREVRWVLMATHYRQALDFSFQSCQNARTALQRVDCLITRIRNEVLPLPAADKTNVAARLDAALTEFTAGLEDDLNISAALAALFNLVRDINRMFDAGELAGPPAEQVLATLRRMDSVLGTLEVDKAADGVPAEIQALADERQAARKAKNFARSDEIRQELTAKGWVIEDTPTGPRCKRNA